MKKNNVPLAVFRSREKAIDYTVWINFKYRISDTRFGILEGPDNDWVVCDRARAQDMGKPFLNILPKDYTGMGFDALRNIRMDKEPLPHWERIIGLFSACDGEILHYVLHTKIPLEKFVRFELYQRGYDEHHRCCGFEKAREIWLE